MRNLLADRVLQEIMSGGYNSVDIQTLYFEIGNLGCDASTTNPVFYRTDGKKPYFKKSTYEFWINEAVVDSEEIHVGQLTAEDEDDPNSDCGVIEFGIAENEGEYPIVIHPKTGKIILSERTLHASIPKTFTLLAEVHNLGQFRDDRQTVRLTFNTQQPEEDGEFGYQNLTRHKRAPNVPAALEFAMETVPKGDDLILCKSCEKKVKLVLTIPPGKSQLDIELFGPGSAGRSLGHIRDVSIGRKGARITHEKAEFEVLEESSGLTRHMKVNLGSVSVDGLLGESNDFELEIFYSIALSKDSSLKKGEKLTAGGGALLNGVAWIGIMDITVGDEQPKAKVALTYCPSTMEPGDIHKINLNLFIPETGNAYKLIISSITPSVTILGVNILPGMAYEVDFKTRIEYGLQADILLTKQIFVDLMVNRSKSSPRSSTRQDTRIEIVTHIQVSPLAFLKSEMHFFINLGDENIFSKECISNIKSELSKHKQVPLPPLQIHMDPETVDLGKTADAIVEFTFPPKSKNHYSLSIMFTPKSSAELTYATVLEVSEKLDQFLVGSQLLIHYSKTGNNHMLTKGKIHLGTVHNTDSKDAFSLKIRVGIKPNVSTRGDLVKEIKIQFQMARGNFVQDSVDKNLLVQDKDEYWMPISANHFPAFNFGRLESLPSKNMRGYGGVFLWTTIFKDEYTYAPMRLTLEILPDVTIIEHVQVWQVGDCLKSLVPLAIRFLTTGTKITVNLRGVQTQCAGNTGLQLNIYVALTPGSGGSLQGIMTWEQDGQTNRVVDKFDVLMPVAPKPLKPEQKPVLVLSGGDMEDSGRGYTLNHVHILLATVKIHPSVSEEYALSFYPDPPTVGFQVCKPRLMSYYSLINFHHRPAILESGKAEFQLQKINYEDPMTPEHTSVVPGIQTITFAVPFLFGSIQKTSVQAKAEIFHGASVETLSYEYQLDQKQPNNSKEFAFEIKKLDSFGYGLSNLDKSPPVFSPGESFRNVYILKFQKSGCVDLEVAATQANDNRWLVDITGPFIHSYGNSIWCVDELPKPQEFSRTLSKLKVKNVCAHGTLDSWIRFELFARPWAFNNDAGTVSNTVERSVEMFAEAEDGRISNSQQSFSFIVDPLKEVVEQQTSYTKKQSMKLEVNRPFASPGEASSLTIVISVPAGAKLPKSKLRFECGKLDGSKESLCTVLNMQISSGSNLAALDKETFGISYEPNPDTNQHSTALLHLGTVTETAFTHMIGAPLPEDDLIKLKATVKLSDTIINSKDHSARFRVHSHMGSFLYFARGSLRANLKDDENMNVRFDMKTKKSSYIEGEPIETVILLTLTAESNRECHNPRLDIYRNGIFKSVDIVRQGGEAPHFVFDKADDKITRFGAHGLYFDQKSSLELKLEWGDVPLREISKFSEIVITGLLTCTMYISTPPNTKIKTAVGTASCEVIRKTTLAPPPQSMLTDGKFLREQLSAPYSPKSEHSVYEIRYDSMTGWCPPVRAKHYFPSRYVDYFTGVLSDIFRMKVKLLGSLNKVLTMGIYTTLDGHVFTFREEVTVDYTNHSAGEAKFKMPIRTRGIRIVVQSVEKEDNEVTFSIDLLGKTVIKDDGNFDPFGIQACKKITKDGFLPNPARLFNRSFLYTDGYVFFCDVVIGLEGKPPFRKECYRITDGKHILIYGLGPFVGQILGYVPSKRQLLAIGADEQSVLLSRNLGKTWRALNRRAYTHLLSQNADLVSANEVAMTVEQGVFEKSITGTKCPTFGSKDWHVCYDGIYKDNIKLIDWGGECPFIRSDRQ